MSNPELPRDEVAAVLAARRELGSEYEPALAEALAERLNRTIDARIQSRLAEQVRGGELRAAAQRAQFQLGVASVALGIPISAITGGTSGVAGLAIAWGGIAAVNVAHALSQRRLRDR